MQSHASYDESELVIYILFFSIFVSHMCAVFTALGSSLT